MLQFMFRRLIGAVITLFFIITLTFVLMSAIPGDPFTSDARVPEQVLDNLRDHYGLNDPIMVQYFKYLKGALFLDFGPSIKWDNQTVNELIATGFPVSAILGIQALAIAIFFGILLGIIAAFNHNKSFDYMAMIIAILGLSVPSFIFATILINFFAIKLQWFPVATWGTWQHSILPSIALAVAPMAYIARLTRSSILEVLSMDYIQTALAKGVTGYRFIIVHVLRNALIPVVTILGPITATILTGSFVIEQIFGIPGLGKYFVEGISDRDYPLILGTSFFYSAILVFFVILVDIAYGVIDPRIKLIKGRD
ncbi:ABC transporter permease [Paenisporosarcina sp. OV554]|uniref:ABC transporter permease n=1 Tax=Paenisporosarcina sp. OV554 TaxID=2135694 RepID=UPI000D3435A6|nr:ABC transporter permease [Paenisporosarcina sp. OV554]PUB10632.1 peptide/nickel transport system permease protein [Paenisporosarcina sp. OV554]